MEASLPMCIADYLGASDVAISFIKSCYSKLSSSPTKIASTWPAVYLSSQNRGVGDVAEIVKVMG